MDKNYKILILLFATLFLIDCGSTKKLNKLSSQLKCEKSIEFIYDKQSDGVKVELVNQVHGKYDVPNYELEFGNVINGFANNMNAELTVNDGFGFKLDSIHYVKMRIERIVLTFGELNTTLDTNILFQLKDKEFKITGNHSGYWETSTNSMFRKTLIDGVYQFLQMYCD